MVSPFLSAKTRLPFPVDHLVTRPILWRALDACLKPNTLLGLVAAPAGAGKTTLLAQWVRQLPADFQVGWLSLDEDDNSLARFFTYLLAALPGLDPELITHVEANPAFPIEHGVDYLVERVAEMDIRFLLVLDDYHVITSPDIHRALQLLIDHLPPNLRLVISGRVEPPLPLARLRARGQMVEVRANDLRFSLEETGNFLRNFTGLDNVSLPDEGVNRLNLSTEGWAAGVQMLALALRGEAGSGNTTPAETIERIFKAVEGSHRYILDYFVEEVVSREPVQIRNFLLRTCVLGRFNEDLCSALGLGGAQDTLVYLERANLFTIPLDGQRKWYRYHNLFADMLQKQLFHEFSNLVPELHQQAAGWFEKHGLLDEALVHALKVDNPLLGAEMVERHALQAILQGRIASAVRWLDSLPADMIFSRQRLCLDHAWALTFSSQTEAALSYLEQAEKLAGADPAIRAEILGLKSYAKSVYGLTAEAVRLAELALEISPAEDPFLQCANHLFLASALVRDGKADEALEGYLSIRTACQQQRQMAGLALLEADLLQYAAIFLNGRNRSRQAKEILRDAIQQFEAGGENRKTASLYLHVGLGKILYTESRLAEAEREIEIGLQLDPFSLSLAAVDGWLTLWWVKMGQGDLAAARRILTDLEPSIRKRDRKIHRLFLLVGALQDLMEGQTGSAVERMERLGLTDDVDLALAQVSDSELIGLRSNEYLVYARVLAAQGKTGLSHLVLERMAQVTQSHGMFWLLYRTWMTQAIVFMQEKRMEQAMDVLAKLLAETAQLDTGAAQVYLSSGEQAYSLLKEAAKLGIHPGHVSYLLSRFPTEPANVSVPGLSEALTRRELEVLRLMADGLRNKEIGEKLFISLNTIRYHTTNIFGKLGVSNRTAAIVRARELKLL